MVSCSRSIRSITSASSIAAGATYHPATGRYTLGPVVELRLPKQFAIEVNALYKRIAVDSRFPAGGSATASRWEFPLLIKYRFGAWRATPYVDAGASLNRLSDIGRLKPEAWELRHRMTYGFAGGAGLEFSWGRLRLVPAFRYTRWVDRNVGVHDSLLRSNLNQTEFLVGVLFPLY